MITESPTEIFIIGLWRCLDILLGGCFTVALCLLYKSIPHRFQSMLCVVGKVFGALLFIVFIIFGVGILVVTDK